MKLPCGTILQEDQDGKIDFEELKKHVEICPDCKDVANQFRQLKSKNISRKMREPSHRIIVTLPTSLLRFVEKAAKSNGISIAEIIRQALVYYSEERKKDVIVTYPLMSEVKKLAKDNNVTMTEMLNKIIMYYVNSKKRKVKTKNIEVKEKIG